jgi:insecticidal toxin complex protein TccC
VLAVNAFLSNPGWSLASTWPQAEEGVAPPYEVTQAVNRKYQLTVAALNLAAAAVGPPLAILIGGYVDELRGTKEKGEKKAKAGEMSTNINKLIAEQRLLENVTKKAQDSLHEQVLEVESLIGITWNTMEMLEKIQKLRPAIDSASGASSRRGSVVSQNSANRTLNRNQVNRIPLRKRPNQAAPV